MTQITIAQWLSSVTPTTGASVLTYSLLNTLIESHTRGFHTDTLWGRIIFTSPKYIAIGYNENGDWTRITCSDLRTAVSHIGKIMTDRMFLRHLERQNTFARFEAKRIRKALQGIIDRPTVCLAKADK